MEGWEEMFNYSINAKCGIKFDLKKFYHEIYIEESQEGFFGFMYPMADGDEPSYFVWTVLPYGYTRAPYIAKSIMRPLIAKWRELGIFIVVFVDDEQSVNYDVKFMKKASLQKQCDLLRAGLFPGIEKCSWDPKNSLDWNGLKWDFHLGGISILKHRIDKCIDKISKLKNSWHLVSLRDISKFLGQISSMHPVFEYRGQLRTRFLQMIVNYRHLYNFHWDKNICSKDDVLFDKAYSELKFWDNYILKLNFRPFSCPPPNSVAWVDASSFAAGGLACRIKSEWVGKYRPTTADNLLLSPQGANMVTLHAGAQWAVAG